MKKLKPTQRLSATWTATTLHLLPGPHPMNTGDYKTSVYSLEDSTSYPGLGPLTSSGLPLCRFVAQMLQDMKTQTAQES